MRVTKMAVIQAASDLADEKGLDHLSLKAVAERLGIRTPSLYNHIDSLEDLLRAVAHSGMKAMNQRMTRAAIGKSGETALRAVAAEYLRFMVEHCGVYETIQWATWHGTGETEKLFADYMDLLKRLIFSCGFGAEYTSEILNLLAGFLHGYTTLQLRYAFSDPDRVTTELTAALDTVLLGLYQKYGKQSHRKGTPSV